MQLDPAVLGQPDIASLLLDQGFEVKLAGLVAALLDGGAEGNEVVPNPSLCGQPTFGAAWRA